MLKLNQLRKNANLTQAEVADYLAVTRNTYTRYENGTRVPDVETLIRLADYFDVSIDYLVGRTEKKQLQAYDLYGKMPFDDVFKGLIDNLKCFNSRLAGSYTHSLLHMLNFALSNYVKEKDKEIRRPHFEVVAKHNFWAYQDELIRIMKMVFDEVFHEAYPSIPTPHSRDVEVNVNPFFKDS